MSLHTALYTALLALALTSLVQTQNIIIPVSKWGPLDEIGAANWLTPQKVLEASKLITTGKTYRLGIPIDRSTPAYPPRTMAITVMMPGQEQGKTIGDNKVSYIDDMFNGWLGIGTQLDSLAHLGVDGTFYNGRNARDFVEVTGVKKMGIEKIPPIVTRGVLLDMAKHKGKTQLVEAEIITADEIKAAQQAQGVEIKEGDVVVLHTGWLSMLYTDPKRYGAGWPGIDVGAAEYLASLNVIAVGADTMGLEAVPFKSTRLWEGHQVLLAGNGIYILETIDTRGLIKDGVKEFMFVLGQPLYTGAVQAIINPVAIC
ncbi:cyclase family protein [Cadophora sp. DSE1049]|nr:cyclase family protein [Cadophora sp. DSE1049]